MRKIKNSELNRLSIEDYKEEKKVPIVVILDNVRSLNNIGSVFRTADAFKIEAIYLCGITGTPPNKEIHKTALGATESVNWKYFKTTREAIEKLRKNNYLIISIEQVENGIMLTEFKVKSGVKYALVFGNEIKGVDQQIVNISDYYIEIPQYGTKHSLNISVSVGIVIWEIFNQIKKG